MTETENNNTVKDVKYRFINLHEEYTAIGKFVHKDVFSRTPCFAAAFQKSSGKVEYAIRIYKSGDAVLKANLNNSCYASISDIKRHMSRLKKFIPSIKYKIEEESGTILGSDGFNLNHNADKFDRYVLKLTINAGNIYHRYALSWIRYLYEFPANMILNDAYRLKGVKGFKNLSIESLFTLASSCVPNISGCDHRGDQSISDYGPLLTAKEIEEGLKGEDSTASAPSTYSSSGARLSDVFRRTQPLYDISRRHKIFSANDGTIPEIARTLSYWISEECFNERVEKYRAALKEYKEYDKQQNK